MNARPALLLLALVLGSTAACAQGAPLPFNPGTFGLVNGDGTEIIALDALDSPADIRVAQCGDPADYPVAFARHQSPRNASSRDIAANFANLQGDVFRVLSGQPHGDHTCYLATDSALVATRIPLVRAGLSDCDPGVLRRLAATKQRRVLFCRPMASAPPDVRIVAVQFATIDTNALASLVVVTATQLLFEDFPATYSGPGETTWRVDDEGVFSPRDFAILFLSRVRGIYVMGLTWAGAEGEDAYLLVADSAAAFRTAKSTYRYWSPE